MSAAVGAPSRRERQDTPGRVEAVVAELLRDAGIRQVLQYLNARTRYRFTGVYHIEPPLLRNVALFDRENPTLDCSGAVARLDETSSATAAAASAPCAVFGAARDARLCGHLAPDAVLCYSGVRIRLASGSTWGTLCHFDLRPRLLLASEIDVLHAVMPAIARWITGRGGEACAVHWAAPRVQLVSDECECEDAE